MALRNSNVFWHLFFWQLLVALKVRYPDRITILRGNHESRQVIILTNNICGIPFLFKLNLSCYRVWSGLFSLCQLVQQKAWIMKVPSIHWCFYGVWNRSPKCMVSMTSVFESKATGSCATFRELHWDLVDFFHSNCQSFKLAIIVKSSAMIL